MYSIEHLLVKPAKYLATYLQQESLALASMARDDQHASSMASSTAAAMRSKVGSELKPKLAIMRRCTSVTDGWTDRRTERWTLTSRKMYILHLARKNICTELCLNVSWSFFIMQLGIQITELENCSRWRIEYSPTAFQTEILTLIFNPLVVTHTHAKGRVQSV